MLPILSLILFVFDILRGYSNVKRLQKCKRTFFSNVTRFKLLLSTPNELGDPSSYSIEGIKAS